ncbi:MAG: cobalamin-dependent protein [Deltaproteobacteria bacterium]|jgi:methanogenic corrinoid protein MtbC1|nr:cobalamin-dependent protein [Deltaproteobacteria bacterium]
MINETMTVEERMQAAIALEPVDRHPVYPIIVTAAPRLYGVTQAEAWADHNVARDCLIRAFKEYGYDYGSKPNYYYPMLPGKLCSAPVRNLIPGKQLGPDDLYQIDERILFERGDYDRIASLGWNQFWEEHYGTISRKTLEEFTLMQKLSNQFYVEDSRICAEQGMPIFLGVAVDSVMMAFSLCRTLTEFTKDLYEVPEKVEAAMQASCDDLIANSIEVCKNNGNMLAFIVLERGSGFFYRLDVFERFEWPFLQRYTDAYIAEGITPWFHFDTDWSINLPYLKQLPKGKCICDLDGTTDIFKAKEILKGHMCISGDVPAGLLSIGKPEEVEAYCKHLIDEVGDGGGFMLTTGCECPIDVKPENLRAMVETGKSYMGKKSGIAARTADDTVVHTAIQGDLEGELAAAMAGLKFAEVMELVDQAVEQGQDALKILNDCRAGMDYVGEKYNTGEYFLSELIMSADIFKKVVTKIEPFLMEGQQDSPLGAMVIATPKGDIHDLGKDIVATLFKVGGFEVFDLGVDVAPQVIVDKIAETNAKIVAMSALITPTFESMKTVVDLLREHNLRDGRYIIIGGGPTTAAVRDYVSADAWTLNPKQGVNWCMEFVRGQKKV